MSEEVINNVVVNEPTTKAKKPKKKKSLGRRIFEYVFTGIFGAIAVFIVVGMINGEVHKSENYGQSIRFGFGSFIILTNSMEPEIPKDSAIITYQENVDDIYKTFHAGGVFDITFANVDAGVTFIPDTPEYRDGQRVVTNRIMTHRLMEMHVQENVEYGKGKYIFVTAGINDQGEQSKKGQYQIFTEHEYLGTVKVTNAFLGRVFNFIVSPVGLIIMLLVPAAYLIIVSSIDIYKAMKQSEEENAVAANQTGKLSTVSEKDRERLKKELLEEMRQKRKEKEDGSSKD